jgi:AraC family transcriptional regulator of adaptative response/methylated-DNA-[protein]-cysteine methyltransferase
MQPSEKNTNQTINVTQFESPIGSMFGCTTDSGICLLEFIDSTTIDTELKIFTKKLNAPIIEATNKQLDLLQKQLEEYFNGQRKEFTVPVISFGTDFQQSVWKVLQAIPYGSTCSYKNQAELLKKPSAVRAVANANGSNKISILIPCHRVIGNDGNLTGYGGGLWRKKWLLEFEKETMGK